MTNIPDNTQRDALFQAEDLLGRYVKNVLPSVQAAREAFTSGRQMIFYWGIDPTSPDVHLGHTTNLLWLKKFIRLGHKAILLIGDFTARIGDPTGKDAARKALTAQEVAENMKTYIEQVQKILPKDSFQVRYNSEWLAKMDFSDVIKLASRFTVQQMIVREMFRERLKHKKPIYLHEFFYPLMQGYDSVAMEVDGEVGGNDQTFNMLAGRELEKELLNKEKIVVATKLLEDPATGKKLMSKSESQYISVNDEPDDMFGKTMAMPDSAILPLLENATEAPDHIVQEARVRLEKKENPKTLKEELAYELVRMYHGAEAAGAAKAKFQSIFYEGKMPAETPELVLTPGPSTLPPLLFDAGLVDSRSNAKRLMKQGAVRVNNNPVTDWDVLVEFKDGDILKVGPRKFARIKIQS